MVLDSLVESLKNVPRLSAADELTFAKSVRQYTLINRERVRAEGQLGRRPTVEEVMERMGYASTAELRRAAREGKAARMCLVEANMRLVINVAGGWIWASLCMRAQWGSSAASTSSNGSAATAYRRTRRGGSASHLRAPLPTTAAPCGCPRTSTSSCGASGGCATSSCGGRAARSPQLRTSPRRLTWRPPRYRRCCATAATR